MWIQIITQVNHSCGKTSTIIRNTCVDILHTVIDTQSMFIFYNKSIIILFIFVYFCRDSDFPFQKMVFSIPENLPLSFSHWNRIKLRVSCEWVIRSGWYLKECWILVMKLGIAACIFVTIQNLLTKYPLRKGETFLYFMKLWVTLSF